MTQANDLSRSLAAFDQNTSMTVVVEMSEASWLVAGLVPGVDRQPLKKQEPDPAALLRLLERWRAEAMKAGRTIGRIALAYEAGRDGFWLARWLRARGVEVHVIHSTSVAVSREHRRVKTDRLDTAMLMRVFLGWLRGERGHCGMVAIPALEEEDAKRPSRERESLVGERTRIVNRMKAALARLGIRGFKPELRKAPQRLEALRTPEDVADSPEYARRDPARHGPTRRSPRASRRDRTGPPGAPGRGASDGADMRWCASWPASSASASRRRTCWFRKCSLENFETDGPWRAMPASRAHLTRAAPSGGRRDWQRRAMPGCAAA